MHPTLSKLSLLTSREYELLSGIHMCTCSSVSLSISLFQEWSTVYSLVYCSVRQRDILLTTKMRKYNCVSPYHQRQIESWVWTTHVVSQSEQISEYSLWQRVWSLYNSKSTWHTMKTVQRVEFVFYILKSTQHHRMTKIILNVIYSCLKWCDIMRICRSHFVISYTRVQCICTLRAS